MVKTFHFECGTGIKKSLMPFGKRDLYINLLYSAKNIVLHTN
jgi:hypothetical protein